MAVGTRGPLASTIATVATLASRSDTWHAATRVALCDGPYGLGHVSRARLLRPRSMCPPAWPKRAACARQHGPRARARSAPLCDVHRERRHRPCWSPTGQRRRERAPRACVCACNRAAACACLELMEVPNMDAPPSSDVPTLM
eukprot:2166026-Prymnesium_polylepis.1